MPAARRYVGRERSEGSAVLLGKRVGMLRTIRTEQLVPGMYVQKFCGSWVDHPFWRSSFLAEQSEVDRVG